MLLLIRTIGRNIRLGEEVFEHLVGAENNPTVECQASIYIICVVYSDGLAGECNKIVL